MKKRYASVLLALILALAMAAPALADDAYSITINNSVAGYEYEAYQIFDGDLSGTTLSNVAWGAGINAGKTTELMTELKGLTAFAGCETAADVAAELAKISSIDHETTKAFADVVAKYLAAGTKATFADGKYTITGLDAGYYLVKNTDVPEGTDAAYTRYILQVVDNVTVSPKGDVPSVDKNIVENNQKVNKNEASVGDVVSYEWEGTLPSNIADYDTYYYVFSDTLDKGLTLTDTDAATDGIQTDVKVEVQNGNSKIDVTKYFYISATENKADGEVTSTSMKVGIEDLLALKNVDTDDQTEGVQGIEINAQTKIIVTYTAKVNENAVIGTTGNKNEVDLEYSNDPNDDGTPSTNPPEDNPDEPETEHPTGKTPKSEVETFTTEIVIKKVDQNGKPLTGAEFQITGDGVNVVVITRQEYAEDENGTYWKLKDGSYTETAPTLTEDDANNAADYDSTTKKYKLETKVTVQSAEGTESKSVKAFVDANGVVKFTGLGAGEYTIKETTTPDGYNTVEDSTVVIGWSAEGSNCTWTYRWNNGETGNSNEITIVNVAGAILPSTGGIGTTIFYVAGGLLVAAAVVLLISRRKADAR